MRMLRGAGWSLPVLLLSSVAAGCGGSNDTDDVHLPVSTWSEPAQPTDFVLTLRHVPPVGVECTNRACSVRWHWVADAQSRVDTSPLAGRIRLDASNWRPLPAALERARKMQSTAGDGATESTLSIRAGPETPSRVVSRLIRLVHAFTEVRRIEFAVDEPGIPGPRRLSLPISNWPRSDGAIARVRIAERPAVESEFFVSRRADSDLPFMFYWPPELDEPIECESTVVGLHALATRLRELRAAKEKDLDRNIFVGLIAGGEAPFQVAIQVFDTLRAEDFDQVYLVDN